LEELKDPNGYYLIIRNGQYEPIAFLYFHFLLEEDVDEEDEESAVIYW